MFYSEQQKEKKIVEIKKLKENEQMLMNENKFLVTQVKEARKQNRLLKIAISKLQNDFERLARQTKHPIQVNYSLHQNQDDNLLDRLDKVIEDHKQDDSLKVVHNLIEKEREESNGSKKSLHSNIDSILANDNKRINQVGKIAESKLNSYADYTHDDGLRQKLSDDKNKRSNRSFSEYQQQTYVPRDLNKM